MHNGHSPQQQIGTPPRALVKPDDAQKEARSRAAVGLGGNAGRSYSECQR